jgi:hypothetical protein
VRAPNVLHKEECSEKRGGVESTALVYR